MKTIPNQRTRGEGDITPEHVWTNRNVALGRERAVHDLYSWEPHLKEVGIHP